MSKKHIEVVAAIIHDGQRILATRRGYGEFENMWEFPGGKIESGESHETALQREIQEELALDIAIDNFLCTVQYEYDTFYLTMHCYEAHIAGGTMELHAHNAVRWVTMEELDDIAWLPADVAVVTALRNKQL